MAVSARLRLMRATTRDQNSVCHQRFMTPNTVFLQNILIVASNPDWLMVILERKGEGMIPTVPPLGHPLGQTTLRQMAVVASRHVMVSRTYPGIVLMIHDVAIDADLRIVGHIRKTFGVIESKRAHTQKDPGGETQDKCIMKPRSSLHVKTIAPYNG